MRRLRPKGSRLAGLCLVGIELPGRANGSCLPLRYTPAEHCSRDETHEDDMLPVRESLVCSVQRQNRQNRPGEKGHVELAGHATKHVAFGSLGSMAFQRVAKNLATTMGNTTRAW